MIMVSQKKIAAQEDVNSSLTVRNIGRVDYRTCFQAMKEFTDNRDASTPDEFWIVEHAPVYTVGLNIRKQHFPETNTDIPVIESDRGGDITYHGPGQVIIYLLLDIRRRGLGIRQLVNKIEQSIIATLDQYQITASRKKDAPGVYVNEKKIAALGLRVRKGCCYHGLAFNVDMDTKPFTNIPPCGYQNLEVTQLSDLIERANGADKSKLADKLISQLQLRLGYNNCWHDAAD